MVKGAVLALPMRSSGERRTHFSEGDGLRRPKGSGMLIGDLYGEGSNASSTNKESDLSQSSGEWRTHSSE